MRDRVLVAASLFLFPSLLSAQDAERRAMLEKVGPSVVAVRNNECYGSGFLLDEQGTILTNAHVIVSPLPFRVEVQGRGDGGLRTVWFQKVELIGVHPRRDLAIIRIDPSEQKVKLTPLPIAKSKPVTRDLVFALGFPSTQGGTQKICTAGEVTGVDQFVKLPGYFTITAEVHHGNSGGPIVDDHGNALGVLTLGSEGDEPCGWAMPLHDFRPDQFVPLNRRESNPANAAMYLRYGERFLKRAQAGGVFSGMLAQELFLMALVEDVSNADTYFKVGMIQRNYRDYTTAAAYLARSLQIQPWSDNPELYSELGIALVKLNKKPEAMAIWNEGIAKYPSSASKIWDALAVCHFDDGRFFDAACATRRSLRAFGPRPDAMNGIYDQSRRRLSPAEITRLTAYEGAIEAQVQQAQKAADAARRADKRFVTPECTAVVKAFEGVQKEASNFDFSSLGKGPNAPKRLEIPDEAIVPLFIRSRIGVAREHVREGRFDAAVDILEDVLKTYPDHPEAQPAKDLLGLLKKSR